MPLFRKTQNPIKDFCAVSFKADESYPEASNQFTRILFSQYDNYAITDVGSNYNATNNVYVVPKDGYYQIITNLRIGDSPDGAFSYGQGAHTSEADNPYFLWSYTNPARQGLINVRATYFNALDEIRMVVYLGDGDGPYVIWSSAMTIIPLGT
jgi:hypothetical protein